MEVQAESPMENRLPGIDPNEKQEAESHLERLLAPDTGGTLTNLIRSIREIVNPPKLAPLEVTSKPIDLPEYKSLYGGNEWKAGLGSIAINAGILGLLLLAGTSQVVKEVLQEPTKIVLVAPRIQKVKPPPPPKLPPAPQKAGGGGGSPDRVTKGELPKTAPKQFVVPTARTVENPKLALAPSIDAPDMPNIDANNIGNPLAGVGAPSTGNGIGLGIGPGKGNGVGPGSGGGTGDGVFRPGGGVSNPVAISKPEPEYSEEARKAKHQGEVWLSVVVDEKGNPGEIKVTRKLGLGLDEKAIDAVGKWRFKPGIKDGKPVKVRVTVAVSFHLL
jgi:periplasmic protein TonB